MHYAITSSFPLLPTCLFVDSAFGPTAKKSRLVHLGKKLCYTRRTPEVAGFALKPHVSTLSGRLVDAPDTSKQPEISSTVSHGTSTTYEFNDSNGDEIKVIVTKDIGCYKVNVALSSLYDRGTMCMRWVAFQSQSRNCNVFHSEELPSQTSVVGESFLTVFEKNESDIYLLVFDIKSNFAPLYIGFSVFGVSNSSPGKWTRESADFIFPVGCSRGQPNPMGAIVRRNGTTNFSLFSKSATMVILCLYKPGSTQPSMEIELQNHINKTGHMWHIELDDTHTFDRYGYHCRGDSSWEKGHRFHARKILMDPYAKAVATFLSGQDNLPFPAKVLGLISNEGMHFDWEDDVSPSIALEEVVAYRVDVTGFTTDKSSNLEETLLGTFEGLRGKIQHFLSLGVNTVILEPIFSFDNAKGPFYPFSFFVPMDMYGPLRTSLSSSISLKETIREFHKNGIEVILDVIYTHTCENNDEAPETLSFRGIDNATYYILDNNGRVAVSELGTDNCFNCNHPVVRTLILDSLRHWVVEYHIDGFFFLNALALTKGPHGEELSRPLLIEEISFDPVLTNCKLFADLSSPFRNINKELTFPHWKRWCIWNTKYCDDVREFLSGKGKLSNFATRLCGSGDIFADGRGPNFSLNHVTSPYSYTLVDLVSHSWNCDEEANTNALASNLCLKQVQNLIMCLFLSQGVPVLNMGDECGVSVGGSASIHTRKTFNWDSLKLDFGNQISHLIGSLSRFRSRRSDIFQHKDFIKFENILWHGVSANQLDWDGDDSSYIGVSIRPENSSTGEVGDIYVGFNSGETDVVVTLPECPHMEWYRIADTSLPYPHAFQKDGVLVKAESGELKYQVESHSSILLEARVGHHVMQ